MREEERFSLFTKYIPETEFLVDSCSKFRSHVDNCRSMLLRRDHCSWKFHSLHFPTAVNRAIKLGISRTPSISLVTGAWNGENETRRILGPLQSGGKFAKPVRATIAENWQTVAVYIHATASGGDRGIIQFSAMQSRRARDIADGVGE